MTFQSILEVLLAHPAARLHMMLPDTAFIPAHFHITEVGRVQKDFIDCGGTIRSTASCVLQVWIAQDTDHRLDTTKLAQIMKLATSLLKDADLPVEVEYETSVISQYPVVAAEVTPSGILFHLGTKHTACLAPDKCGVGPTSSSCCTSADCC